MVALLLAVVGASDAWGGCPDGCPNALSALQPGSGGTAASFAERRSGSEIDAEWRIGVTQRGIHRITYSQLVAAGMDPACLVGGDLRMYCRTQEIAIAVTSEGLWSTNDYLMFFGLSLNNYYSLTNVYWLGLTPGGLRMETRDAAPLAGATVRTTACERATYAPNNLYRSFYQPLDSSFDHWFANLITGNSQSNFFSASSYPVGDQTGVLRITLHGLGFTTNVNPDHHSRVSVNGAVVTNLFYDGEVKATATVSFASSLALNGSTPVSIEQVVLGGVPGNGVASAYLQQYEFHFPREMRVVAQRLSFGGEASSNNYRVFELASTSGVIVLDVADPFTPVRLTNGTIQAGSVGYTLTFGHTTPSAICYYVSTTNSFREVQTIERVQFRHLAATNRQADFLVVCPYEFQTNAYKLLKHRANNGLTVAVAPLPDIYNEFGYGITDAEAIKQFVGYAFHHWASPKPRYLVLMGDGTFDPKANLGDNSTYNWVPVKLGPTPFNWTAMDNWYADVNGTNDNLIDLAVGRIPATNDISLGYAVDKIINFEGISSTNAWHRRAILISDVTSNGFDFVQSTTNYITPKLVAGGVNIITSYRRGIDADAVIKNGIAGGINNGRFLINYMGHGSEDLWAASSVWSVADVNVVTNLIFPIVTVFTCKNGIFQNTNAICLAEAFVLRQNRGAVACVAPTELSIEDFAEKIAAGFYQAFGANNEDRLGDSLNLGLSNLFFNGNSSAYELMGYQVFGDPALLVYP